MMEIPFISLVLPVYNVQAYIKRCVDSIVCQTSVNYEILLIDDGSTDDSARICDELALKYENVRAYHKMNGGLSDARNYGLDRINSASQYIAFIDSDDWISADYLEKVHKHIIKSNPDIFKYGFQKVQDGNYGEIVTPCFEEGVFDRNEVEETILPDFVGPTQLFRYSRNPVRSAWSHVYSVDFLKKNNIRFVSEREILNEDYLFNLMTMLCAQRVEIVHDILYFYDYREGSLSKRYIKDEFQRKCKLHVANKEALDRANLYNRYKKEYYSMCLDGFYSCCVNECSGWSASSKKAVENIGEILKSNECKETIKNIGKVNSDIKGYFIMFIMRHQMSNIFYYSYRMMKLRKRR